MKEDTRVVSVDSYFGKKSITKKEFVRRWSTPAMEIWTLFQDHGTTTEERFFGHTIFEKTEAMAAKAFEKFYGEENKDSLTRPSWKICWMNITTKHLNKIETPRKGCLLLDATLMRSEIKRKEKNDSRKTG
jgi:hypothetical protein